MNAFVKKEIRLLLPGFAICCVLALPNLAFRFNSDGSLQNWWWMLSFGFCAATTVMLALNSFGLEISSGTFSNLLAQPISRQKIWDTKILLLMTSLAVLGVFWSACGLVRLEMIGHELNLLDLFTGVVTFGLVVFSGSLWTVLLLRQVAAAFWFTLLVPGLLMVLVIAIFGGHSDEFMAGMTASVLGLYSLGGFFFARWLFMRAQDLQWSGGTIVMPEMRGLARFKSAGVTRSWRPRAALWKKEFQLHQSQYVMAFALLVLHLIVIAARNFCDLKSSPDIKFVLKIFWGLWLVMPLLIGCAAVAEERKLGTLEAQLCLPVNRRAQFMRKFVVAMGLSVVFGFLMPLLLEGTRILPGNSLNFSMASAGLGNIAAAKFQLPGWEVFFLNGFGIICALMPVLIMIGLALLIALISFYASSLARNTLQTLAPAVLGILLACFLCTIAASPWEGGIEFLWRGPLAFFILPPLVLLTLAMLAFGNFQNVRPNSRMIWRNVLVILLVMAFGVGLTSAVYHRAWEKLTPAEPPHGEARFTLANPACFIEASAGERVVRLPDGRIWLNHFKTDPSRLDPVAVLFGNVKTRLDDGAYLSGSNWLTVQSVMGGFAGLKADGSLWISQKPWQGNSGLGSNSELPYEPNTQQLTQFGNETNWASLAGFWSRALLIKNDGTLWRWGVTNIYAKRATWPTLKVLTPYQLGTESNWSGFVQSGDQRYLRKADGSLWAWNENGVTNSATWREIAPSFAIISAKDFGPAKYGSTARIQHGLQFKIGVREDGTFRIWADQHLVQRNNLHYGDYEWFPTDLQIGNDTNWLAVAGDWNQVITLKKDGTLWRWDFRRDRNRSWWGPSDLESEVQRTRPVRLGTHADWIAISGSTALAADGSLWYWPLGTSDDFYDSRNDPSAIHPLLDISHKPQWLGNVLGKAN